jgi:hypothetical protein
MIIGLCILGWLLCGYTSSVVLKRFTTFPLSNLIAVFNLLTGPIALICALVWWASEDTTVPVWVLDFRKPSEPHASDDYGVFK